jgi:hypothetical protein
MRLALTAFAALGLAACAPTMAPPGAPSPEAAYEMIVANESADVMSRVTFEPGVGLVVVDQIPVGVMPTELDSPHGVAVSRDRRYWFVTLGHGTPFGWLWKFDAHADTALGRVELGPFPASLDVTPDGRHAFVVNFNLHGDPVPSTVSVVDTETMEEVARPMTCVMPHGSRIDAAGAFHYSVCMHSDQLVLIDTRTFEVSRRISLAPGREGVLDVGDTGAPTHGAHAAHGERHAAREHHYETAGEMCSPTWATPGRGDRNGLVYVPCNRTDVVLEVDPQEGVVRRTFATGRGPYNTEVTPDGRMLLAAGGPARDDRLRELRLPARCCRRWAACSPTSTPKGTPGKRYYGGCEVVDEVERLAQERLQAAVRRRPRQRAAAFRRAGQHGHLLRAHGGGRHAAGDEPLRGRAPDPRLAGQLQRPALQRGGVRRA